MTRLSEDVILMPRRHQSPHRYQAQYPQKLFTSQHIKWYLRAVHWSQAVDAQDVDLLAQQTNKNISTKFQLNKVK